MSKIETLIKVASLGIPIKPIAGVGQSFARYTKAQAMKPVPTIAKKIVPHAKGGLGMKLLGIGGILAAGSALHKATEIQANQVNRGAEE